jgi:hypothetical protein
MTCPACGHGWYEVINEGGHAWCCGCMICGYRNEEKIICESREVKHLSEDRKKERDLILWEQYPGFCGNY